MNRLEYLKGLLKDDGTDPFIYFALAKEYEKMEDWKEALSKYTFLMKHHPAYVGTYYHAGKLYEILLKPDEALLCYQEGIRQADIAGDLHSKSELEGARMALV